MLYVVTSNNIIVSKSLKELNKRLNSNMELTDFKSRGKDYIITLSNDDIEFVQDAKKMSRIMIQNLFKKSDSVSWILYIIIGLQIILLLKG